MSATILSFPIRAAKVIPISAARVERKPETCATSLAMEVLRDLYVAARCGQGSAVLSLKLIIQSHDDCDVARLADALLRDLREGPGMVDSPSECEMGEPV